MLHGMNDRGERTIGAGPDLQTRLHRIDRRVHGRTRMIEAGRPAVEALDQIAPIRGRCCPSGWRSPLVRSTRAYTRPEPAPRPASMVNPCVAVRRLIRNA